MLKLGQYLNTTLPESETFYLFQYLISSRIENGSIKHQNISNEAEEITRFFSATMSRLMGVAIDQERNRHDLYSHIQPLLYRLKHEITIKNDLLHDIELEYQETFQLVEFVSKMVQKKFHTNHISKDEIGFLTLYFVRYKELAPIKKRVLIMCSSGVGTSELLKVKVKKAFPEFSKIDLILTTVCLNEPPKIPTILVNSVFTKQDEKRVKQMLGEM